MLIRERLKGYKVILASQSPRRKELLKGIEIDFLTEVREIEEVYPDTLPIKEVPSYLAKLKASAYKDFTKDKKTIIITADTVVVLGNKILGKPGSKEEAKCMLLQMSGRTHEVITAVCLRLGERETVFSCLTKVKFKPLSDEEIDHYVSLHKPMDKAGAYGVQEWMGYVGVEWVEGSFYNVMGLPTSRLHEELIHLVSS